MSFAAVRGVLVVVLSVSYAAQLAASSLVVGPKERIVSGTVSYADIAVNSDLAVVATATTDQRLALDHLLPDGSRERIPLEARDVDLGSGFPYHGYGGGVADGDGVALYFHRWVGGVAPIIRISRSTRGVEASAQEVRLPSPEDYSYGLLSREGVMGVLFGDRPLAFDPPSEVNLGRVTPEGTVDSVEWIADGVMPLAELDPDRVLGWGESICHITCVETGTNLLLVNRARGTKSAVYLGDGYLHRLAVDVDDDLVSVVWANSGGAGASEVRFAKFSIVGDTLVRRTETERVLISGVGANGVLGLFRDGRGFLVVTYGRAAVSGPTVVYVQELTQNGEEIARHEAARYSDRWDFVISEGSRAVRLGERRWAILVNELTDTPGVDLIHVSRVSAPRERPVRR
jgi:hypothetical protein